LSEIFVIQNQGILNIATADNLLSVNVYVGYRRQHPNKTTVKDVLKELQKNNIDVSQLVEFRAEHCQWAESSTEKKVPSRYTGVGNGTQPPVILNILDN